MKSTLTPLHTPCCDLNTLNELLGWKGYSDDVPVVQYLAWSEQVGLFSALAAGHNSLEAICKYTELHDRGADAVLGILSSLKLVHRDRDGLYELSAVAREYLVKESPYYAGVALYAQCGAPIPQAYLRGRRGTVARPGNLLMFGTMEALENQHARNFAPAVVAVRTGQFEGTDHLVDIGGGSGVFAIPLALDYPQMRITLADLPEVIQRTQQILSRYGVADRIDLLSMNVFSAPWHTPACDGILFGNFFHGFDDHLCRIFARQSFEKLIPGGRIWLHEMLWNVDRNGPLTTALWNASIRSGSVAGGRQRSAHECIAILQSAAFVNARQIATSGGFSLIVARKPNP